MFRLIAKQLGFEFNGKITFVPNELLPDMFIAYIIDERDGIAHIATGDINFNEIVAIESPLQTRYSNKILQKPIIMRKFTAIDQEGFTFLSSDVSKVYSPTLGRLVCKTHPKHGLTKKFAPIGKVYNEIFNLLPIKVNYTKV